MKETTKVDTTIKTSGDTAFKTGFMGAFGVGTYGFIVAIVVILLMVLVLCCCCSTPFLFSLLTPTN